MQPCSLIPQMFVLAALLGNPVFAAEIMPRVGGTRLHDLVALGDARVTEDARQGVAVAILENPDEEQAGELLLGAGAALFVAKVAPWIITSTPAIYQFASSVGGLENLADFAWNIGEEIHDWIKPPTVYAPTIGDSVLGSTWATTNSGTLPENGTSTSSGSSSGNELVQGGFLAATSDLAFWPEWEGAIAGLSSFGPIIAPSDSPSGAAFGLIHTGFGEASDQGRIEQTIISPRTSAATFTAQFNFVTTEFPGFLGSQFNDSYVIELVHVQSGATKEIARFEGALNQIFSESDINTAKHIQFNNGLPVEILDRADTGAGQTGWQTVSQGGINLLKGQQYLVRFRVNDIGDRIYDSALLIQRASLR